MVLVVLVVGDEHGEGLCFARAGVVGAFSGLNGFGDLCGCEVVASVSRIEGGVGCLGIDGVRTGAVVSARAFSLGVGSGRIQRSRGSANARESKEDM